MRLVMSASLRPWGISFRSSRLGSSVARAKAPMLNREEEGQGTMQRGSGHG